jgi:hypothetical protein
MPSDACGDLVRELGGGGGYVIGTSSSTRDLGNRGCAISPCFDSYTIAAELRLVERPGKMCKGVEVGG